MCYQDDLYYYFIVQMLDEKLQDLNDQQAEN